jgi:hypothetical protein
MASDSAVMAASQVPSDQKMLMKQLGSMQSEEDGVDDDTKRKRSLERTFRTRIWQPVAGASIVMNIVAMAIEQSTVSIVAGIIAVLIAPVVIIRQFQSQDTDCKFDGGRHSNLFIYSGSNSVSNINASKRRIGIWRVYLPCCRKLIATIWRTRSVSFESTSMREKKQSLRVWPSTS